MEHTPKTFESMHIYFTKVKNTPDEFYTHLFFASEIILIFGGLFLHSLYGLLKVKLNWIRVSKTEPARKKTRTRRDDKNSSKISWRARKKPPKGHTKNIPFFLHNFKGSDMTHTLFNSGILRTTWI